MNPDNTCYTCFPTSKGTMCVEADDIEKVVRNFMHPTDDVKYTLWLFDATTKCFDKNNKNNIKNLKHLYKDNNIIFDKV